MKGSFPAHYSQHEQCNEIKIFFYGSERFNHSILLREQPLFIIRGGGGGRARTEEGDHRHGFRGKRRGERS